MKSREVSLIGAGNVGSKLITHMTSQGFSIKNIYSRDFGKAEKLATATGGTAVKNISGIADDGIIIIAVPDDFIDVIATQLNLQNAILVHVSGAVTSNILVNAAAKYGVLYPVQTISALKDTDWQQVPFCIFSPDAKVLQTLEEVATALSEKIYILSDEERLQVHLAAVFANNFTTRMLNISGEILQEKNISSEILFPLIKETMFRAFDSQLQSVQTGPAARSDKKTMEKHLELLSDHPGLKNIYAAISENIQQHIKNNLI